MSAVKKTEINNVIPFRRVEFGELRTLEESGQVYFVATDAAKALGYVNTSKAISDHCKGVTKRDTLTEGGMQKLNFIPEGDLYRLIARSKLKSAERFEEWVFDEVLPTIRKTGSYSLANQSADDAERLGSVAEFMGKITQASKNLGMDPEDGILFADAMMKKELGYGFPKEILVRTRNKVGKSQNEFMDAFIVALKLKDISFFIGLDPALRQSIHEGFAKNRIFTTDLVAGFQQTHGGRRSARAVMAMLRKADPKMFTNESNMKKDNKGRRYFALHQAVI